MMTVVTFADAWYVGQLGTTALASLALAFPFLMLMQMTSGGAIGSGGTSSVARALGTGDLARAEANAWHAKLIAAFMAAAFMAALGVFARSIFELLGGKGTPWKGLCPMPRLSLVVRRRRGSSMSSPLSIAVQATR